MEPNKENIRLWVEWLRTKGLKQNVGSLAAQEHGEQEWGYCCLGVACEAAIASGLNVAIQINVDTLSSKGDRGWKSYDNNVDVLPESVIQWLGLDSGDPVVRWTQDDNKFAQTLSTLNDQERWDFARIADAIEYTFLREEGDDDISPSGETSA